MRRVLGVWLLLACLVGPASAGLILNDIVGITQPDQDVSKTREIEQARVAFRERQYDLCLAALEQAQKHLPALPPARLLMAVMFLDDAQPAAGRVLLEPIVAEQRANPLLYDVFGRIALAESRINDAELNFERSLELLGRDRALAKPIRSRYEKNCELGLASVAEARQDWKQACERLSRVLKSHADDAAVRQRLGRDLFQLGDDKQAYAQLSQAATDDSRQESAAIVMGRLYAQRGDAASAEQWLMRAVDELPNLAHARVVYGNWLLDQGRPADAARMARQAEALEPAALPVRGLSGLCARHEKRFADAEKIFQQLHVDEPGEFQWSNQLALSLIEQLDEQKQSRALQLAEVNARQYPQMADALATLGWVSFRLGRQADAQRNLNAAVSGGRASSDTAFYLARLKSSQNSLAEARTLLTTALGTSGHFVHRDEAAALLERIAEKPASAASTSTSKPAGTSTGAVEDKGRAK